LIKATALYHTHIARRLIESNLCNVAAQDKNGFTALYHACATGCTDIVRLILQRDASTIDTRTITGYQRTPLIVACVNERASIIEHLIRSGANVELKDKYNRTCFDILAKTSRLSTVEIARLRDLPRLTKEEEQER